MKTSIFIVDAELQALPALTTTGCSSGYLNSLFWLESEKYSLCISSLCLWNRPSSLLN